MFKIGFFETPDRELGKIVILVIGEILWFIMV